MIHPRWVQAPKQEYQNDQTDSTKMKQCLMNMEKRNFGFLVKLLFGTPILALGLGPDTSRQIIKEAELFLHFPFISLYLNAAMNVK